MSLSVKDHTPSAAPPVCDMASVGGCVLPLLTGASQSEAHCQTNILRYHLPSVPHGHRVHLCGRVPQASCPFLQHVVRLQTQNHSRSFFHSTLPLYMRRKHCKYMCHSPYMKRARSHGMLLQWTSISAEPPNQADRTGRSKRFHCRHKTVRIMMLDATVSFEC